MKTLKTSIYILAIVMLGFACNNDENPGPGGTTIPPATTDPSDYEHFEATFIGDNPNLVPFAVPECGTTFRFEFQGEGESNLLGQFNIFKRYCFENTTQPVKVSFDRISENTFTSEGEFTLASKEADDTIIGTFSGDISFFNGIHTIHEVFTITGGTGNYQNTSGNLYVDISGKGELSGKISGDISQKTPLP